MRNPIQVVVAGLPGNMATLVAEQINQQKDMNLQAGLGGHLYAPDSVICCGVTIFPLSQHDFTLRQYPINVVVDFTTPEAVNRNAELYVNTGRSFVMGTTGGDRQALLDTVKGSRVSAVIDVNMGVPIVVVLQMIRFASTTFPGSLSGWTVKVRESHQRKKKDTSGTAKTIVALFEKLGVKLVGEIESIRDREDGHGHHLFTLQSPDGTATIEINTKVEGRQIYADGTLKAIRFLHQKVECGSRGEVFDMLDVLTAGKEA